MNETINMRNLVIVVTAAVDLSVWLGGQIHALCDFTGETQIEILAHSAQGRDTEGGT